MLALIFCLAAAGLFLVFFLPASVAIVPLAFLLIVQITCIVLLAIHDWKHRRH